METTRRAVLTRAAGVGAVASLAGLSTLLSLGQSASAAEGRQEQRREREYPKIHSALEALRAAREELSTAGDDFHGHKDTAVRAVDDAIQQLQALVAEHPH